MENIEAFRKAIEIKQGLQSDLCKIANATKALHECCNDLKKQVSSYFEEIISAIKTRESMLFQQIDDQRATIRGSLQQREKKLKNDLEECARGLSFAMHTYALDSKMGLHILQEVNKFEANNCEIPELQVKFSPSFKSLIENEGSLHTTVLFRGGIVVGSTSQGFSEGQGEKAKFSNPWGVAFNQKDGCCYVADSDNQRIRKVSPKGVVSTLFNSRQVLHSPTNIIVNQISGEFYITDYSSNTICKISPTGQLLSLVDFDTLFQPYGLTIDHLGGYFYVSDYSQCRILRISPQGDITTVAGGIPRSFADGLGLSASFNCPAGIDINPHTRDLYVTDELNHRIRKITTGQKINTFTLFSILKCYRKIGTFYINLSCRVAGIVSTIAGTGKIGSHDGNADEATFSYPCDVKVNYFDGSLLVADYRNHKIRKIFQGNVTTLVCASISFNFPFAISIDHDAQICYVTDKHSLKQIFLK